MRPDASAASSEFRRGWTVVAACFGTAVMAWGFGIYGQSVFLAELRRIHGWSAWLIGGCATVAFLLSALLLAWLGAAMDRFGPRAVLGTGIGALAAGTIGLGWVDTRWQLLACELGIGLGWACCSSAAIATTLARWFDAQRGFALGLALSGASTGGFVVAPLLVTLSARMGFRETVLVVGGGLGAVLLPLVLLIVRRPPFASAARPGSPGAPDEAVERTRILSRTEALRSRHFWSLAAPFAVALCVQVGFIFHQVAFLVPLLGPGRTSMAVAAGSLAALGGRLGLGIIVDRLDQRRAAAIVFLLQAGGIAAMLAAPQSPAMLFAGCVVFGISVGSLILLPAMIVKQEFEPASFGLVLGLSTAVGQTAYALFPGLLGAVHDLSGGYQAVLACCVVMGVVAAAMIARSPDRATQRPGSPRVISRMRRRSS